jgi:hypothetical protein
MAVTKHTDIISFAMFSLMYFIKLVRSTRFWNNLHLVYPTKLPVGIGYRNNYNRHEQLYQKKCLLHTTHMLSVFFGMSVISFNKNSESDYFFFLHQNQNIFFQQHWESEYFFRKFFF